MSRFMKDFSDHFMSGLQLGAQWAEKWQAQKLADARNKIMAERYAAQDRRENAKLGLYGQKVANDIKVGDARAFRIMNPVPRGGGKGGAPAEDPAVAKLIHDANARGMTATLTPDPSRGGDTINYLGADPGETDAMSGSTGDSTPPAPELIDGAAKGGMIRKMAGGGSIEEGANMSIQEAEAYGKRPSKASSAGGGLGEALGKAIGNYKPKEEIKNAAPTITRGASTNLIGSGEEFRQGGAVRQFQSGGRVLREPMAIDTGMSGPGSGYGQRASPPARGY